VHSPRIAKIEKVKDGRVRRFENLLCSRIGNQKQLLKRNADETRLAVSDAVYLKPLYLDWIERIRRLIWSEIFQQKMR